VKGLLSEPSLVSSVSIVPAFLETLSHRLPVRHRLGELDRCPDVKWAFPTVTSLARIVPHHVKI
jgi:hypothetical protein